MAALLSGLKQPDTCRWRQLGYLETCLRLKIRTGYAGARGAAAEAAAEAVGLAKKLPAPAAALSGGMKRKLQVALALLGRPAIVVIDEGSSGAHRL